MISYILKSVFDFSAYKVLASKKASYAVLFLAVLLLVFWGAGSAMLLKYVNTEIPKVIAAVPAFNLEKGVLDINNFTDTKIKIADSRYFVSYEPARKFPPQVDEFVNEDKLLIVTKSKIYAYSPTKIEEMDMPPVDYNYNPASKDQNMEEMIKTGTAFVSGVVTVTMLLIAFLTLFSSLILVFLIGLLMRAFNGRQVTGAELFKISAYMQTPMAVLFAVHYFIIPIPGFKMAQILLAVLYFSQIFKLYKQLGGENNVTQG
ncbi:hypothetical protein Dip510_001678 [Elusimicrobium posterum]|uniref:DUF1189 family protein n=1 Tax=Elusimicrobium posterum TaxID=3116653 RepID=UPI003C77E16D